MISELSHTQRRLPIAAMAFILLLLVGTDAAAQRFQAVYGGPNWPEAGRGGVTQLSTGGYVAVGETFSPSAGANSDIYVVVTNVNGGPGWTFTYNIGGNDSATDVIEDANGFIVICGVTGNGGGCATGSRDIFILKLTATGAIFALNTFGQGTTDEIAWSIIEAQYSAGGVTLPGDYIVAGSTTFQAGTGLSRDGYIIRTNAALNMIWDMHYGGITSNDEYFYGVEEAPPIPPAPPTDADIVAVGATNTWGSGGYDYFIVRVDGINGIIGAPPENAAAYGGPLDDIGRAVVVMRPPVGNNDLIFTGSSLNRGLPSTNSEIYMLLTGPDPTTMVTDLFAGDNGTGADEGLDVKMDQLPPVASRVIVTGYTQLGTIAPPNVFLGKFAGGTLGAFPGARAFGGSGTDWGWSVDNCLNGGGGQTLGYVVAGFTQSANLIGTDPEQLYLIKTDVNFNSGCNGVPITFSTTTPGLTMTPVVPTALLIGASCTPTGIVPLPQPGLNILCWFPKRIESGDDVESHTLATTSGITVTNYPNPIKSGTELNLGFDLKSPATATIVVSDIVGREIYRAETRIDAGEVIKTIETNGWPGGSYIVRIEADGMVSTARVVLLDR